MSMTEKLYYTDSHCRSFEAVVTGCRPGREGWEVTLSRTAFFPEGGGQRADTGTLGGVSVRDVQERDGEILHFCDGPLTPGEQLRGEICWEQRFQRMQCHSAEHILSGLAHRKWGCSNVGFHMAPELITLDFDRELDTAQLRELEREANRIVWEDLPVRCWFPHEEELACTDYRSKKELSGAVRLVEIPGADLCACCAPHVKHTGEIGLIRLTDSMRHRGGMRLSMKAGALAYEEALARSAAAEEISRLLSVPRDDIAAGVERLQKELAEARGALLEAEFGRLREKARSLPETEGNLLVFEPAGTNMNALRELVNTAVGRCGGICGAFSGSDGEGWRYILASRSIDLRTEAKAINAGIAGRGGGSSEMLQGSASADRKTIEAFFKEQTHG